MDHREDRYQNGRYRYQYAKDLYQALSTHDLLLERFAYPSLFLRVSPGQPESSGTNSFNSSSKSS